jgi:hypothetical protein
MSYTRFRIRALMIAVALTAVVLALIGVGLGWLHNHDFPIHDTYFTFGSPR